MIPSGRDFVWQANATASGLNKPNVHLWHPSAANTNLYVYRVAVANLPNATSLCGWTCGRKDTTLSGSPVYASSSAALRSSMTPTTVADCTTSTDPGNENLVAAASGFLALRAGDTISGTNIAAGTRILSITSDLQLRMTQNASGAGTQTLTFGASAARVASTTSTSGADGPISGMFRGVCEPATADVVELNPPIVLMPGDGLVCKAAQGTGHVLSVTFFGRECP